MLAILNSLNAHNFLIFQPILIILVSKFMVYRALSDKTYLLLGLQSPLRKKIFKGFGHIWAWQPSWSYDQDHFYKYMSPLPKEAPQKIWL